MSKFENPQEHMMTVLRRALSLRRPHGSIEEGSLLLSLAFDIKGHRPGTQMFVDPAGNLHVDLRAFNKRGNTKNRTLFVAHVDTVHRTGGPNVFDSSTPVWKALAGQPLGADDGAGVAMLSALIRHGKPAYYIFTRGEECGGVGSTYLAAEMADILEQFDRAIAFDRKDVFSVITRQGFVGRCCSDAFGEALCDALNAEGMLMMTDDTGVYTDTAEFVEIIPECTNISAGYYKEHTPNESLDTEYLKLLLAAALALDWDALPTERDPNAPDDHGWGRYAHPAAVPTVGYLTAKEAAAQAAYTALLSQPGVSKEALQAAEDAVFAAEAEAARLADEADWHHIKTRWDMHEGALRIDPDDIPTLDDSVDDQDPAFSWSDDMKTFNTGSGKKGH